MSSVRARMRLFVPFAAAICLLLGCRDSTGPRGQLNVALAVIGAPKVQVSPVPGNTRIVCDVAIGATITGPGIVVWREGVLRYFVGVDRTTVQDTVPIAAADVQQGWTPSTAGSLHPELDLRFTASVPFEAELELHYAGDPAGGTGTAKTRFACGPVPPTAGVAAPTISNVVVTPSTGDIQSGETFTVSYTATSPYALWSTAVRITGPYTTTLTTAEDPTTTATRTVRFVVPPGAQIGVPLGVNVIVQDAGMQQSAQYVQTQTVIGDRTPPSIYDARLVGQFTLAGQVAVGDPLQVTVGGSDNNALSWLVWELSGSSTFRDSIPISGSNGYWSLSPIARAEWVGTPTLSLYVRDGVGLKSTVISSPANGLRIYPSVQYPTTPAVPFTWQGLQGLPIGDIAYDAKRNVFYVVIVGASGVAVLDVATMTLQPPIMLPATPVSLDLSPSGDSLIAALQAQRSLAIVNLLQPAAAPTTVALSVLDTAGAYSAMAMPLPGVLRVAANGKAIVTLTGATRTGARMMEVNLASGAQRIRSDAMSVYTDPPRAMAATRDRGRLIIYDAPCSRSYLAATDAFTTCALYPSVIMTNPGITVDSAGQRMSLGNAAFTVDFARLRDGGYINYTIPITAISPDGASLYLGASNSTVTTMRIADGTYVERFRLPFAPTRMFVAPGGEWLVAFGGTPISAVRVNLK